MAQYDNLLELLFRLVNFPFMITGYSSLITVLSVMTSIWSSGKLLEEMILNPNPIRSTSEYDFIVVGAGSAGSTLANRLSENGLYKVLLLEAGGDPTPYNSIPSFAPFNLHQTTDWNYRTEPQKDSCESVDERRMHWPRGKMVGGSSQLNFMIYMRGNPRDFDHWAEIAEDDSWRYENLLPLFKKSENYNGNWPDPRFHGTGGPLSVSKQNFQPIIDRWLEAGRELGFQAGTDPNTYQSSGFHQLDVTMKNGMRAGTYESFIKPFLHRSNFQLYRFAHVTKINLDENNRATGVTYVRDGRILKARARKEIIISAGAIGTPQLLLLSGIGPAEHLIDVGIKPRVNLPGVGRNLQDHVLTTLGPFLFDAPISFVFSRDFGLDSVLEYGFNRTGPIAFNIVSGVAFLSSSMADPHWPDLELHMAPLGIRHGGSEDLTMCFGLKPNVLLEYLAPYSKRDASFVLLDLGRPKSTGTIELRSTDPFVHPKIDPKYFDHPDDMQAMIEGMYFIVRIFEETEAFRSVGARLASKKLPGCEHLPDRSPQYFECYIRHLTMTIYHPCCTAAFGRDSDPMAVLDSKLRVRGVEGLRVADASVFPKITNANINAPSIMIGEKAAEMILSYWDYAQK